MDELQEVRCALVLGHYSKVLTAAASTLRGVPPPALLWEREFHVVQAQSALQQYDTVLADFDKRRIADPAWAYPQDAAQALVMYLKANEEGNVGEKVAAIERLTRILAEVPNGITLPEKDATIGISVATVYLSEGRYEDAVALLRLARDTLAVHLAPQDTKLTMTYLRICSLLVEAFLQMNRVDLAESLVAEMNRIDDDAVPSMVTTASYNLHLEGYHGGAAAEKLTEADRLLDDLIGKFGPSVLLLNMKGAIHVAQGAYDAAERVYVDALEKRSTDATALIGLCRVSVHLGKPPEFIERYITQLKTCAAKHPWVKQYMALERFTC